MPVRTVVLSPEGTAARPPGRPELFPLWSITKTVIATQVLQLVAGGALSLDAAVQRWRPDLPAAHVITIDQLLTHRSGLPDYGGSPAYRDAVQAQPGSAWSEEEFLELARSQGLTAAPGTAFHYSNLGYLVLRLVVQAQTGLAWAQAVQRDVLAPAGLDDVVVLHGLGDLDLVSPAARPAGGHYHPGWVAHGLLAADVHDLARLMVACLSDARVLAAAGRRFGPLHRVDVPWVLDPLPGYGRGVMGSARPGGTLLGHTGAGPGSAAAAYVDLTPDGTVRAAAAAQASTAATSPVADAVEAAVAGILLHPREVPASWACVR